MMQISRNIFIGVLCAILSFACSRSSDEEQIRAIINSAEAAAEARHTSGIMDLIADDYSDDMGSDKSQLQNVLRGYFLTHPKIKLLVTIENVNVEGPDNARVHLELSTVGTEKFGDSSTSLTAQSEPLRIDFKRVGAKWRMVHVERRRD